jgi:hypothetical protein
VSVPLRLDLLERFASRFGRTTRADDEGEHQKCDQDRSDAGSPVADSSAVKKKLNAPMAMRAAKKRVP